MADVEHVNLTGADIHEPRGLAAVSSADRVYKSNGSGSGTWTQLDGDELSSTDATVGQILVADGANGVSWADAGGITYGEMAVINNTDVLAVSAVADTTFNTDSQYIKIDTGLWAGGPENGVTFNSSGYLEVSISGTYQLSAWLSASLSTAGSNVFAIKFSTDDTNGTLSPRKLKRQSNNADDIGSLGATAVVELTAGNKVSLWVACDASGNLTLHDAGVTLILLAAD